MNHENDSVDEPIVDEEEIVQAEPVIDNSQDRPNEDFDFNVSRLSAKGGVVGSVLLGVLTIVTASISAYTAFNGIAGILFAVWGYSSRRTRMAAVGLLVNTVGLALCAWLHAQAN